MTPSARGSASSPLSFGGKGRDSRKAVVVPRKRMKTDRDNITAEGQWGCRQPCT
jgi:hypothetical protein